MRTLTSEHSIKIKVVAIEPMEELRMILSVYRNYAILKNRNNRVAGWR